MLVSAFDFSAALGTLMEMKAPPSAPDSTGHFGRFGGMFVPETLMAPLNALSEEYERARVDEEFQSELDGLLSDYCGRPTPLYYAERWSKLMGGG